MPLAVTVEHRALAEVVRSFVDDNGSRRSARLALDDSDLDLSGLWTAMAELGWLALHLPETFGGGGYGLFEAAVVAEELGRALMPVPYSSTVVGSAVLAECGTAEQKSTWLPGFANGSVAGGLALGVGLEFDAGGTVSGTAIAIGGRGADLVCAIVDNDLVLITADSDGYTEAPGNAIDPTMLMTVVACNEVTPAAIVVDGAEPARLMARALGAAEASGGASATLEMAVEYAKLREQFGRPIGSFQAVKHHCANMLVSSELAVAAAWDAARATTDHHQAAQAVDVARCVSFDAFVRNAELSLQIHGGIGFTWEHDCHLFLRRAQALRAMVAAPDDALDAVYAATASGSRRDITIELPPESEGFRTTARDFIRDHLDVPDEQRRASLVDSGYVVPHWKKPFGRAATAVEQLVIDEEFADIEIPQFGIGGWVLLTLTEHGSDEQFERWIRPSLMGDLVWCQLFSEPGAGSDAAAVSTRGVRVDGGWRITGQKVWTSNAQNANRGLATIRTNREAPKHKGITTMVVDLAAEGVTVRPLREISGDAVFNEVFFDNVFVPDADVVGAVDAGWTVARATLGNERVSIGSTSSASRSAADLPALVSRHRNDDQAVQRTVAGLIADEQAMRMVNLRHVAKAVAGSTAGPEGSVTKLLSAENSQKVSELAMRICGETGVIGDESTVAYDYLFRRAITIAGGTSEINRNVIAERVLGLPREMTAQR
jgi:alkylation response protein AidB-like acyl-CoA dehydrogenase